MQEQRMHIKYMYQNNNKKLTKYIEMLDADPWDPEDDADWQLLAQIIMIKSSL